MTVCVRADSDGAKTLLAIGGILWAFAAGVMAATVTADGQAERAQTAAERAVITVIREVGK